MEQNTDLYSFPFQKIHDFLDTGVDKKLEDFYNSFQNQFFGQRIKSIDKVKMEVHLLKDSFHDGEEDYSTHVFEKEIKHYLNSLIYISIKTIAEGVNICFTTNQSVYNHLDKLERQFNNILKHPKNKEFPFLKKQLFLLQNELDYYKKLDGVKSENEYYKDSPFKPKDNIGRVFFIGLYNVAILNGILKEDFPNEDFLDVFISPSTNKYITFDCDNQLIVTFFEAIKECFNNLNAKSISESKRFYTKQDKLFNASKYYSTKNRIKSNSKINDLNEDLEELTSNSD